MNTRRVLMDLRRANREGAWSRGDLVAHLCASGTTSMSGRTTSGSLAGRSGQAGHTSVWTGTEMITWGGYRQDQHDRDGLRYDPGKNSWKDIATAGAPSPRIGHTAIWTGTEMIIWGGHGNPRFATPDPVGYLSTGARCDPSADAWTALATRGAPSPRMSHTAVWTGKEMIVWGGRRRNGWSYSYLSTGGRYVPSTDQWTPIAASSGVAPTR